MGYFYSVDKIIYYDMKYVIEKLMVEVFESEGFIAERICTEIWNSKKREMRFEKGNTFTLLTSTFKQM